MNVEYIDGTKIESKANKYTFVWRKTVERNRERLMKKIHVLLGQIDDVIVQENSSESNEEIEFTPAMLTEMAGELRQALEQVPEPSTKEEKAALKKNANSSRSWKNTGTSCRNTTTIRTRCRTGTPIPKQTMTLLS